MVLDPDFTDVGKAKTGRTRPRRWIRQVVLFPLLVLSGCHLLLTGFPVPLWHIDRLDHPVAVTAMGGDTLVLADGRRVRLSFIKRVPKNDAVFIRSMRFGVEVRETGDVFGLIEPSRMCGNDPVAFYRERVNLSELAGFLDPNGIDDSIVHPDEIRFLKENYSRSRDRHGMPYDIMGQLRRMRRLYEDQADREKKDGVVTQGLSLE